ncbi:4-diphosphocytidyl-2-C-methyl-D-erythritol kinase [Rhizobium sp. RU36D]|nr:4-diphosphocytidyl-2-C-methyl-D-erythritol kinase [Rhizobium sp. RU36D]
MERCDDRLSEIAAAKINLALHVVGRREDGYHLLDSLVTFASTSGDRLSFAAADQDGFSLSGRFGHLLSADDPGNLVLKARDGLRLILQGRGLAAPPVHIHLEKNLPVAAGIGGGSADAAATLRGLARLWNAPADLAGMDQLALKLGADVPMCLRSRPLHARGIGEEIEELALPRLALVLANPLVAVSTPDIFRRLTRKDNPPIETAPVGGDSAAWLGYLGRLRNDLEAPARSVLGAINEISMLLSQQGAQLVRMSGSGATCFGIYADLERAKAAVQTLSRLRPNWYFEATETYEGATA